MTCTGKKELELSYSDIFVKGNDDVLYCSVCGYTLYINGEVDKTKIKSHVGIRRCSVIDVVEIYGRFKHSHIVNEFKGPFRLVDSSWEELYRFKHCGLLSQYGRINVSSRFAISDEVIHILRSSNYNEMLSTSNTIKIVFKDKMIPLDDALKTHLDLPTIKKHYIRYCVLFTPKSGVLQHLYKSNSSRTLVCITRDSISKYLVTKGKSIALDYNLVNYQPYATTIPPANDLIMEAYKHKNNFYICSQLESDYVLNTTVYFFSSAPTIATFLQSKALLFFSYEKDTKERIEFNELNHEEY